MDYAIAIMIARKLVEELRPFCDRIDIAGSLRRKKPQVKDIEIVCIPRKEGLPGIHDNLFGACEGMAPVYAICRGFIEKVNSWKKIKGEPTGKFLRCAPEAVNGTSIPFFPGLKETDTGRMKGIYYGKDNRLVFQTKKGYLKEWA